MTRTALSASQIDVNNAINGGGPFAGPQPDGEIVIIPATPTPVVWTFPVIVTAGITIIGHTIVHGDHNNSITSPMYADDQTILLDDIPATVAASSGAFFDLRIAPGQRVTLQGITMRYDPAATTIKDNKNIGHAAVTITCPNPTAPSQLRITQCHFDRVFDSEPVLFNGWLVGVMDHCVIHGDGNGSTTGNNAGHLEFAADNYGGLTAARGSWIDYPNYGTDNFFFVEDNTWFSSKHPECVDGEHGMRVVFRYNVLFSSQATTHGSDAAATLQFIRGPRVMEAYGNQFYTWASSSDFTTAGVAMRSGTYMVHNNIYGHTINPATGLLATQRYVDTCSTSVYRIDVINSQWLGANGTVAWDLNAKVAGTTLAVSGGNVTKVTGGTGPGSYTFIPTDAGQWLQITAAGTGFIVPGMYRILSVTPSGVATLDRACATSTSATGGTFFVSAPSPAGVDLKTSNGTSANPTVSSNTYTFAAGDIGKRLNLYAGTSWIQAPNPYYTITNVVSGNAILDRPCSTNASASLGTFSVWQYDPFFTGTHVGADDAIATVVVTGNPFAGKDLTGYSIQNTGANVSPSGKVYTGTHSYILGNSYNSGTNKTTITTTRGGAFYAGYSLPRFNAGDTFAIYYLMRCLDQDAAGIGDLVTLTPKYPNQNLEPLCFWSNHREGNDEELLPAHTSPILNAVNLSITDHKPIASYDAISIIDAAAPDVTGAAPLVPPLAVRELYNSTGGGGLNGPAAFVQTYQYPHDYVLTTPRIISGSSVSFTQGVGGTFQVAVSGFSSPPTFSKTGGTFPATGSSFSSSGLLTVGAGSAAGVYTFTINAVNGSESDSQPGFTLTITAAPTRVIAISGSLVFGDQDIGTTATKSITITNNGNVVLTVSDITLPSGFTADWTSGTIAPGASHNVVVTFSPVSAISYSGTVTVVSDKTGGTNTVAASGTGTSRVIGLSGNLSFGNITTGQTATRPVTITNSGNRALVITAINYPEGFSGDFTTASIAAGANKILNVMFSPTAVQAYGGPIDILSNKTSGTGSIAASGAGVSAPTKIIQLTGDLTFGSVQVGTTQSKVLTLVNSGTATLTVTGITFPTGFSGDWTSGTIAAGATRNINVTFAPLAATTYSGTVTVASDATGGTNTTSASGTGSVATTRIIALSGDLNFGNVLQGTSANRTLTITNSGTADLNVTSLTLPSGFSGTFSGAIAPGASQPVTITFSPSAIQSYSGTVTVNSDATSGTNTTTASGTGVAPTTKVILLAGNLSFGNVQRQHSVQRVFTITNQGTSALTVTNITAPSGFTVNWTSGSIAPGATQNVTATFRPLAVQTYSGVITVVSDKTSGVNTIACSGTGTQKKQVPFFLIVG